MINADKFKSIFGLYATELWSMPEKDFLKWLNSEVMNCSEIPNNSDTISRQAAIEVADAVWMVTGDKNVAKVWDQLRNLPLAQPESAADAEFWRKRADYYSNMCMDLIAEMGKGVKIESVKISENGIEFIKEQPPSQPKTEERMEKSAQNIPKGDLVSRKGAIDAIGILLEQSEDDEHDKTWNNAIRGSINAVKHQLPSAQPDRSLWFRIGEICVDESKGFISAGRAVEKIRELLRETERSGEGEKDG